MKLLKQAKNLWNLSKIDPDKVEQALDVIDPNEVHGDGGAVFFDEGTESDYQEFVLNTSPWRKFYNKLKGL